MGRVGKEKHQIVQCLVAVCAACLVFAVMQGIHDNYGIMLKGIVERTGMSYARVSFVIAVGQILYGVTQPLFGMLALRKSNALVMLLGVVLMAAGLVATPFCTSLITLLFFFGILLPAGTGALCFGIVMGAISPIIGERRAAMVSGIVQASAGVGDALMSSALQILTDSKGIGFSMPVFSIPILLTLPAVVWLGRRRGQTHTNAPAKTESLTQILSASFHDPAYWRLLIGFSTCGFHMAIIETHLYSQYISCGIPANFASLTLTVYGITTMLGSVATGFLSQKFSMKNVLGSVYAVRIFIALGFLFLPKSIPFAFLATGALGLAGDSTVAPTTGIISNRVGVSKMAVVYGSIFIGHQLGAFSSAWLGGVLVSTPMGYSALWLVDLALCAAAAVASFGIKAS